MAEHLLFLLHFLVLETLQPLLAHQLVTTMCPELTLSFLLRETAHHRAHVLVTAGHLLLLQHFLLVLETLQPLLAHQEVTTEHPKVMRSRLQK